MAEDTQQAESPVTETPETPMPSVPEQQTPEVETPKDGLPSEASDRTKHEFEKLQSQLREERQRRESLEGAFKSMQQPKAQGLAPIIDPDTGYLNENALKERDNLLIETQQRAAKAETDFQQYRKLEEERVAYQSHPWLDPKAKDFDKERYNLAVGVSLSSMVNPESFGGKQLGLKDAGDFVANLTKSQVVKAQEDAAKQAIEQLSPKEQAGLEATGSSMRRNEVATNLDTLRSRTRRGDIGAAMERLKAISAPR